MAVQEPKSIPLVRDQLGRIERALRPLLPQLDRWAETIGADSTFEVAPDTARALVLSVLYARGSMMTTPASGGCAADRDSSLCSVRERLSRIERELRPLLPELDWWVEMIGADGALNGVPDAMLAPLLSVLYSRSSMILVSAGCATGSLSPDRN